VDWKAEYGSSMVSYRNMLSALHAIAHPSVHHTGGSVKTVEVMIMKFSPYSSPSL